MVDLAHNILDEMAKFVVIYHPNIVMTEPILTKSIGLP